MEKSSKRVGWILPFIVPDFGQMEFNNQVKIKEEDFGRRTDIDLGIMSQDAGNSVTTNDLCDWALIKKSINMYPTWICQTL